MKIQRFFALSASICALSLCAVSPPVAAASTMDLGGVKIENNQTVQGANLQLNGAGIRYKAVFKVYTAALYLDKKASTTEEILLANGSKRMTITMLREIDANELGRLFTKGIENNVPYTELTKMLSHLMRMGQIFADQKKLTAGDTLNMDWVPGLGTVITIKGVAQGEPFKDPEFFNGMMRIWLGKAPADYRLKDALLGKPAELVGQNR